MRLTNAAARIGRMARVDFAINMSANAQLTAAKIPNSEVCIFVKVRKTTIRDLVLCLIPYSLYLLYLIPFPSNRYLFNKVTQRFATKCSIILHPTIGYTFK